MCLPANLERLSRFSPPLIRMHGRALSVRRKEEEMELRETPILQTRWWSKQTVAVVTGANKGIGFELVRQLAEHGLKVVLTSRDAGRGKEALMRLHSRGLKGDVVYRRLDVMDPSSVHNFLRWVADTLRGLDVHVNNAGVSFGDELDHVETVMQTNFYGPKLLTESLLPMFRPGSRILNISSRLGLVNKVRNPELKRLLSDEEEKLNTEAVEEMVESFLIQARRGRRSLEDQGWPAVWPSYSVSKLALNAYSAILAKRLRRDDHIHGGRTGIYVNCFCPGFTMTNFKGARTAASAARYAVQILLRPNDKIPTGQFFLKDQPLIPRSKL